MAQSRKKRWTVAGAAVLVVIAGLFLAGYYLASRARGFVAGKLEDVVRQELGGFYVLTLDELRVSFPPPFRTLTVRGSLSVLPDSAAMDTLPHRLYSLRTGQFTIDINRPLKTVRRGRLDLGRVYFDGLQVEVVRDTVAIPRDTPSRRVLQALDIRRFRLRHTSFSYMEVGRRDTVRRRLGYVRVDAENISVDSLPGFHLPGSARVRVDGIEFSPAGEGLALRVDRAEADLAAGRLTVDTLRLVPRYDKARFAVETPSRRDWLELTAGRTEIYRLDFGHLLRGEAFTADSVTVSGIRFGSFKNRNVAAPHVTKPLFHRLLQNAGLPVAVGRVRVSGSEAFYEEMPLGGFEAGSITISNIGLRIDSLTNIPSPHRRHYRAHAVAMMMGVGRLTAIFRFPIAPGDDHFEVSGTLGRVDMAAFNPMIRPLGHLEVRTGRVERLDFAIGGDSLSGTVDMALRYDSLQVDVLNKVGLRSWVGSTLVNSFVILPSNPMPGKELRHAHGGAVRDPYKSNFNYWWRLVFAGVKESAGLTDKKQSELTDLQKMLRQRKERREERQAARDRRRDDQDSK